MEEAKHLYDWAGTEAYWLEEVSTASSGIPDVPELPHQYDDDRILTAGSSLAVEPVVISLALEQPVSTTPPPRSERSRDWLVGTVMGAAAIAITLASVGVFSGKDSQKKASSPKTDQPVNPPASRTIAPATEHIILPPEIPPANIDLSPNFRDDCQGDQYDDSTKCVRATLSAIDNARAREGITPMKTPLNWYTLTPAEQLFVATNLERTDRGLPPLTAMNAVLDQAAAQAAEKDTDPSPPNGFPLSQWASNWAGAVGNPLEAIYFWMYDDGPGSANVDCTATKTSGCWGHRNNVLMNLSCQTCLMGVAVMPTAYKGDPSLAEILVDGSGQ